MAFISTTDRSEASHQILGKLVGAYTYTCPIHDYAFEVELEDESLLQFKQQDLVRPAHGMTFIETRYPTLSYAATSPSTYSEVSISTTVQLHHRAGRSAEYHETFILRLGQHLEEECFTLWRPKKPAADEVEERHIPPVHALQASDLECLGSFILRLGQMQGSGRHQRQEATLEMRRTNIDVDDAKDYDQPWNMFKICLYIGPGASQIAKQAGFEIRRSEPYWLYTVKDGYYDWNDGRVELLVPADEDTRRKWVGPAAMTEPSTEQIEQAKKLDQDRTDSVMSWSPTTTQRSPPAQ